MKKLIVKIGNETHELPYNGEVFSFEISEKYVPKVGDCVKIYFKTTRYEYFSKISQIVQKEIRIKSAVNEIYGVLLNLWLHYDYSDIVLTQITPEELKAKYAEAGYDWDYETNEVKPLKWMPKNRDKVYYLDNLRLEVNEVFYDNKFEIYPIMLEKGLLFKTEAECQNFVDHCMSYINNKKD